MPPKRKRPERASDAGSGRQAPHRPTDSPLAQHDRDFQDASPHRRASGGGRNTRRNNNDRRESSNTQFGTPSNHRGQTSSSAVPPRPTSSSSHTMPPPAIVAPPPPSIPVSSNYNYLILTQDRLSSWQQSGRQEVIDHGVTSRADEDDEEISTISQEFLRAVLENRLSPTDAGTCMKQILGAAPDSDETINSALAAQTLFLDTISVFIDSEENATGPQFRDFIAAIGLSPKLMREVLDAPALQQLGLIRDNFTKLGIKYATNQLYRQANYNLLREETEGYSKLAAELYRTPYQSQGHHDFALVQASWERIKALIGTFDLDVGRVLDVVIDVFSATMLRSLRFFTRLLRISSWWPRNQIEHSENVFCGGLPRWALPENEDISPEDLQTDLEDLARVRDVAFWERAREIHLEAFFELAGRRIDDEDLKRLAAYTSETNPKFDAALEWMKITKTLPPCGNRVAAQLLGFKFRFYTSDARDKGETLPANLYYLAAFLIKIGFVSLADLYAHLWPADEDMDALKRRREEELAEKERSARQGNEPNALLMAGALTDDTVPTITKPRETNGTKPDGKDSEKPDQDQPETGLPEPKEAQKADLVSHLLVVGAIPEALFIIGRFPWLPEAYPDEIYPALNRIILHSLSKVYDASRPVNLQPLSSSPLKLDLAVDQGGMPKGNLRSAETVPSKILRWPHADGTAKGVLYRFYLDEWSDNVPVCQSVEDVFTLCHTFLNISGVNIGRDATLVKKLATIGVKSLYQDKSSQNMARWHDLLRRILVPSLCLTSGDIDAVKAVWELLEHYPTQTRYAIYAECYEGSISRLEAMKQASRVARLDTLATLKRLSLENIPMSAKKLAKIALSSPGVVCKVALDQIEAYTNLIEAFVECTKYFTEMGYDVLVWSLLSSLGGKQRSRTSETSVLLTSRWLQALSKFSGKVFRRYQNVDPTPVLQYVNNQVAQGNSTDLVILRELITSMAGIVPDIDFTDSQLSALSGGELLRRQTLTNLGDKRYESEKSASRFMKALLRSDLASQLLINIAQYRQTAIFQIPEGEAHIKFLATVIDDSQQALVQYLECLHHNLTAEEFDARVPNIPTLMADLGLDTNLAFMIGRASLTYYMTGRGDKVPVKTVVDAEGDVSMEPNLSADTPRPADGPDQLATEVVKETDDSPTPTAPAQSSDRFIEVLSPVIESVKTLLPEDIWNKISAEFFVLFWALQTGDLEVPIDSYKAVFARLDKERDELKRDRSDMSRTGANRKEARMTAIERSYKELPDEASICKERVTKTKLLLVRQSPIWFSASAKPDLIMDTFIEECLLPRLLISPGDADYCHRLIKFLHVNRVSNFKLSGLYNRFFGVNRLRSMIFGCTVREAEFLGRFIKLTLGDLSVWHQKQDLYEKEAIGNGRLSFATALDDSGKPVLFLSHDEYRDLLWTWHRNLFAALKACLGDMEWMHIRNAITVLKTCLDYFPSVDFMGKQLQASLAKIAEREAATKSNIDDGQSHRVDLSVTANTLISALKKCATKWVLVQAFRSNTSGDPAEEKKPIEANKSSHLRPTAPEFKPHPNSGARTKSAEEEDGEVDDGAGSKANLPAKAKDTIPQRSSSSQRETVPASAPAPQKTEPRPDSTRPSAPAQPTVASSHPFSGRQESVRSTLAPVPSGMHGLPSRPEVPFPAQFKHDQFGTIKTLHPRGDHRDGRDHRESREPPRDSRDLRDTRDTNLRDARDQRDPRSLRGSEDTRNPRMRDNQLPDRRMQDNMPREAQREPHNIGRDRAPPRSDLNRRPEPGPQERDSRPPPRDRVSPAVNIPREDAGRDPRDLPAPVRPTPPQADAQGPTVNPERARLINADHANERPAPINPARAAILNDGRHGRGDSRDRTGSRGASPRRGDRPESRNEPSRDDRRSQREPHGPSRDHRHDSRGGAPMQNGRATDQDSDKAMIDRSRDPVPFPNQAASRNDHDHNRFDTQDPDYGRLSSIPTLDNSRNNPPEGPRGRGRAAARGPGNLPPGRPDSRPLADEVHRPSSPDRQHPPTGPSSSRPRRNQGGAPHAPGLPPTPTASATGPTMPGVHPERLRQLNSGNSGAPPSQSSYVPPPLPATPPVSVHPDRMAQINPSSAGGGNQHSASRPLPPLQTPDRPHGPMSGHRQPFDSHPITPNADQSPMAAPTGPAATHDRGNRTGGRRQLSGINSILQGGPNVRAKGSRSNLAGSDAQVLTGASPVSTPVAERMEPFPAKERSGRSDQERGRKEHESSERSSRGAPRASRDRERSSERDHRSKEHRTDYRDHKSGVSEASHARDAEKDSMRRSSRDQSSTGREPMPPSSRALEIPGGGRDGPRDRPREQRHRGDGGNGRHEENGRSSGGRRGGQHREDRRGDPRNGGGGDDHRNRKRQSEEFGGPAEKRQRR
ncbi:hypothetical protein F5Y16DRAFT_352117 [Xylariaceae sp. FL0255]|nr:hypothetical protein F5Y16DRAFT_352117 [Xylariaceae sp. FL0255]